MSIASIVKVATTEFETKMAELGKNLDTRQLTADLAEQVSQALQKAISAAGRAAYKAFLESYDSQEPVIIIRKNIYRKPPRPYLVKAVVRPNSGMRNTGRSFLNRMPLPRRFCVR